MGMDSMDQGGIKWGAEIAVSNCKPDWVVQDDTPVWWQDERGQSNVSTTARLFWQQSGGDLIKIKLPANHSHYQKQAQQEVAIDPALVERMRLLLVDVAGLHGQMHQYQTRAKDILKALEPVDPDEEAAATMADEWRQNSSSLKETILAAIRRGRALERGE